MRYELIPAHNPGPYTWAGNNTYLIPGEEPVLIDAGTDDPRHLEGVAEALARTKSGRLARILVTHAHVDHASGVEALAVRWPEVTGWKMPWPERDARYWQAWHEIGDEELIRAGDRVLRAVHTPGHAPDHLCFFDEPSGLMFTGDLMVSGGTVMIPASAGGDLAAYLDSLRRVLTLEPRRLLPAHGPVIDDPAALVRRYLDHRQQREDQILAAVGAGADTIDRVVAEVYAGLDDALVSAARESVRAHLQKLCADGRVVSDGERWESNDR